MEGVVALLIAVTGGYWFVCVDCLRPKRRNCGMSRCARCWAKDDA